MSYDELIEQIMKTCKDKNISVYKLAQLSDLPASTIYGVFRRENKAQLDTLSMMLGALGLGLTVEPLDSCDTVYRENEDWYQLFSRLTEERQRVVWQIAKWLGE